MQARKNLSRKEFLRVSGASLLAASLGGLARACTQRVSKPNIVFILADDLGYGDLSCYGATKIQTPNIDRLAKEGVRFTDAHSPASVCTPTRYNLLTGRYSWRTWAGSSTVWANDPLLINEDRLTLGKMLQNQGYRTACIGKWHLGFGKPGMPGWDDVLGPDYNGKLAPGPLECGFDYFWGVPHVSLSLPPHVIIENHHVLGLSPDDPIQMLPDKRDGYEKDYLHRPRIGPARLGVKGGESARYEHEELAVQMTKRAVSWLKEQNNDQSFFLYLAHRNIHSPLRPNERFKGKSPIGVYGDFIAELDWTVGEVLKTLDQKGLSQNTLVFFSSDNGAIQDYNNYIERISINGHAANGVLRGQKTEAFEGGTRVPLLARWPVKITAGRESNALVALTDVMATLADYFNVELPENAAEDSFSFLGALLDKPARQITRENLVMDSFSNVYAIRKGDWKLIQCQHGGGFPTWENPPDPSLPPGQLYHLGRDLSETKNEYLNHPDIVDELTRLLKMIIDSGRSAPVNRQI